MPLRIAEAAATGLINARSTVKLVLLEAGHGMLDQFRNTQLIEETLGKDVTSHVRHTVKEMRRRRQ